MGEFNADLCELTVYFSSDWQLNFLSSQRVYQSPDRLSTGVAERDFRAYPY